MKKGNKINTCAVYVSPTEENTGCEISEIFFFLLVSHLSSIVAVLSFMLIVLADASLHFNIKLSIRRSSCIKICTSFKR